MSHQQGDAPDLPEVVGTKPLKKKVVKPFEIWTRPCPEFAKRHNYVWLKLRHGKDYQTWRLHGRYKTRALAEWNLAKRNRESNLYENELRIKEDVT
jgi:hypothetical protein